MEKYDIEASLRKINNKFVEEMTPEDKQKAVESFKKVYAQQMTKATDQIIKRKKVYDNLSELKKQQKLQIKSIEEDLNQKMAKFEKNRSKHKQSKLKEHKILQENWKRRWETMVKKRRSNEIESFQKADKVRKETQQYFVKRHQFLQTSKTKKNYNDFNDQGEQDYHKKASYKSAFAKSQRSRSIDHYKLSSLYKPEQLPTIQRKTSSKKEFESINLTLDCEPSRMKGAQIKYNRQKFEKYQKQKEGEVFQRMVNKLQKIQKNRENVQERKQKLAMQAKKLRQQKENPEKIARNRQRSLDALNLRRRVKQVRQRSIQNQSSKRRLNDSIFQHLQAKKLIQQSQFDRRQKNFLAKFQKIKKTKIDKLVKEVVHNLKHQTLSKDKM